MKIASQSLEIKEKEHRMKQMQNTFQMLERKSLNQEAQIKQMQERIKILQSFMSSKIAG